MKECLSKKKRSNKKDLSRRYFPLAPGQLSHKHGYDIGEDYPDLPEDERDNPLVGRTPRLNLPGREAEVEQFYQVGGNVMAIGFFLECWTIAVFSRNVLAIAQPVLAICVLAITQPVATIPRKRNINPVMTEKEKHW